MHFELFPWRFQFVASEPVRFDSGQAGNTVRGAFGHAFRRVAAPPEYERIFEPRRGSDGPSGFADPPRPFVLRAAHLDGQLIPPGSPFFFDLHLFDVASPMLALFVEAFAEVGREGVGPGRGRSALHSVRQLGADGQEACAIWKGGHFAPPLAPLRMSLGAAEPDILSATVRFVTPTELKAGEGIADRPEFRVLYTRARDRVSALAAFYGPGPLPIDFRATGERAAAVRLVRCELRHERAARRSTRTGQTHPIGGFTGEADYEGQMTEFLPILRAAAWTGVGRQTVWGKGHIEVVAPAVRNRVVS